MFDSHPQVRVPGESRFLPGLIAQRARFEGQGVLEVSKLLDFLAETPWFGHWGLERPAVDQRLLDDSPRDLAEAIRCLFRYQADAAGKPTYADKSPPYVLHMPAIASLLPESRFVHLVRDGRDVALAYVDAPFGPTTSAEAALHWMLRVERGRRAGQTMGPRYFEVRYEDLVADPEGTLRTISAFLGISYAPEMLSYQGRAEEVAGDDWAPTNHSSLKRPPTTGLRDWRVSMSQHDRAIFELLAGRTLERFGYEHSSTRPGPRARAAATSARVRWESRRVWHKVQPASRRTFDYAASVEAR